MGYFTAKQPNRHPPAAIGFSSTQRGAREAALSNCERVLVSR